MNHRRSYRRTFIPAVVTALCALFACVGVAAASPPLGMEWTSQANGICVTCHSEDMSSQEVTRTSVDGSLPGDYYISYCWFLPALFPNEPAYDTPRPEGAMRFDMIHNIGWQRQETGNCFQCHLTGGMRTSEDDAWGVDPYNRGVTTWCGPCHASEFQFWWQGAHGDTYDYWLENRPEPQDYAVTAPREAFDCVYCHQSRSSETTLTLGGHEMVSGHGTVLPDEECAECHQGNLIAEHAAAGRTDGAGQAISCETCHESGNPEVVATIAQPRPFYLRFWDRTFDAPYPAPTIWYSEEVSFAGRQITSMRLSSVTEILRGTLTIQARRGDVWSDATTTPVPQQELYTNHIQHPVGNVMAEGPVIAFDPPADAVRIRLRDPSLRVGGTFVLRLDQWELANQAAADCGDCHGTDHLQSHEGTTTSGYLRVFDNHYLGTIDWLVQCSTCHASAQLVTVHGRDCDVCHAGSAPAESVTDWNGSCQQGPCHPSITHEGDSGHLAVARYACEACHEPEEWGFYPTCADCHSPSTAAPTTTSNVPPSSFGSASIALNAPGVAWTFYRLDGGARVSGDSLVVPGPASGSQTHTLEFWSVDDLGREESPHKTASFTLVADTTPPVTISDAVSSYTGPATIRLTASDAGGSGVASTHYRLDGGVDTVGTTISVPDPGSGTVSHTLEFWSVDRLGNVETPRKTVSFTSTHLTTGTILFRWDNPPSDAWAEFYINGVWVAYREMPGWNGWYYATVPISQTPYNLSSLWWDSDNNATEQWSYGSVLVDEPGETQTWWY